MKKQQTVPIVQQDLSHEETIVQIAFSLEALEKVVSNIFSNVECAIERKKKRLYNLQSRCEIVRHKVDRLSNFNKSIKVFSSYKYPGPRTELFYKDPLYRLVEINEPTVKVKCSSLPPDKFSLKEKLKFYHVRDSTQALKKSCEASAMEGLGELPSNCSKINSLLLYNTSQNLYQHYKLIDPLSTTVSQTDVNKYDGENSVIESDPISIGSHEPLGYKNIHNYFYSPSVQDVPDIEAPLDLPRLTGIAGDLRYTTEQQIQKVEVANIPTVTNSNNKLVKGSSQNELNEEYSASPSPQPPPPLPPPPPVPPPPSVEIQDVPEFSKANANTETVDSIDIRANLMAAIRQAGGKSKLKHVNHDKPSKKPTHGKSLMDDLHEKLHMRRKGISGKMDNTDVMLDRIGSMIPLPPAPVKLSEEDDDEDWDD